MALTVILPKVREKRPYRLRCRFQIDPHPSRGRLDYEKVRIAEQFVEDMRKQGWEHDTRAAFTMTGPYPKITPITLHPRRMPSAWQMFPGVRAGYRFRDEGVDEAQMMPTLAAAEYWEYELASVFVRPELLAEVPDLHEERGGV